MENNVIICTGIWFLSVIYATGLSPDGQALLQFKSLLSDEFNKLSNWSSSDSTPCNWVGVSCNQDEQVFSLNLGSMNLSGSVSGPPISSLRSLSNLSLELNNFTSATLPQEIFTPSLRFLNISHCNFNESFPRNLSAATSLEVLDAYNNNFSDELPYGVGNLQRLTYLHLGGSLFTGSIPAEYGSMKSLRFLSLSGNQLTGPIPPELGDLERLEELYLGYYNVFTGGIPPELGRLQRLRLLDIASSGVNGTIPDAIGNLTSLDSLFLMINSLSGSIPDSLGRLPGLKSLDLSQNKLTGEIPQSFDKLVKLELLSLFQNQLTGTIPSFIGDLPNLQVLQMWGNTMVGPIPEQLGGSGRLQKLDLSKNLFNGSIPLNLCQGGQLDTLILQQNHLTGGIPDMLGDCPSLMRVRLADNMLAGLIPGSLFSLPNLNLLELMRNHLDGFTQEVTFTSQNLEWVDLSENKLRGELPDGIGNLLSLKLLQVSSNKISGAVPAGLGKLALLDKLNMSHNLLTGGVPEELGNCQKLTMLDLSVNQLSGEIPSELGNLLNLNILNLSRNFFSGGIPKSISGIGTLSTLDYSYNRLTGEIPHSEQAYNRTSYVGNPGLCGPPLGRCQGLPQPHRHGNGRNESLLAWLVGALFSAALLVLVFGVCCFFRKYRYYICGLLRRTSSNARSWKLTTFQRLDLNVNHILECMNEDNIIGQGGSGTVYKGVLPSGDIVAVKKLSGLGMTRKGVVSSHSDHGFSAEVQTLGKIRHRNIVRLLGFCTNKETNVLVYEYMPNGSLGEALHGKKGALLDWGTRYKIAMQAANGLAYLHHDCSPLIVHRDVKSNNILLDTEFQAHVADFGLAKLFQDSGKSESMSSIAGSYGYIAPEYAYTLKVNEKSDIYSFGVVLLELVTGRRPIEPEYGDGVDIVQWVRKKIQTKDGVLEVLDSRIGTDDNLPLQEVMLVLRVALLCTSDLPVDRPTMRDVVQMLGDAKPSKGKEGTEVSEFSTSRSQLLPPV